MFDIFHNKLLFKKVSGRERVNHWTLLCPLWLSALLQGGHLWSGMMMACVLHQVRLGAWVELLTWALCAHWYTAKSMYKSTSPQLTLVDRLIWLYCEVLGRGLESRHTKSRDLCLCVRMCVCVCVCVCASNTGLVHRNPPSLHWPPSLFL